MREKLVVVGVKSAGVRQDKETMMHVFLTIHASVTRASGPCLVIVVVRAMRVEVVAIVALVVAVAAVLLQVCVAI